MRTLKRKDVAATGVFTAFVAAATILLSVSIAATGGYFNVGEIMVYTTALLMGPYIGGFAGGVGSMIADLTLGYPQFAPGTLVIKGLEGLMVGFIARSMPKGLTKTGWRLLSIGMGVVVASVVWRVGVSTYVGESELYLSLPGVGSSSFTFVIPELFWIGLAILVFIVTVVAGFSLEPAVGWLALAVLVGGVEMVTGYFLYEWGVLRIGFERSLVEVPFNIGQMMVGLIVSLPIYKGVVKLIPRRP